MLQYKPNSIYTYVEHILQDKVIKIWPQARRGETNRGISMGCQVQFYL